MQEKKAFFPNVVLWGDSYVRSFLDNTAPTILAPGNLDALGDCENCEFLIVCPPKEREFLENSEAIKQIRRHIMVRFLPLDWDMKAVSQPILNLSLGHQRICELIAPKSGYGIFLSPDCLLSAGSIAYLRACAEQGARAVSAPGFRLTKELAQPAVAASKHNGVSNLSGRDLVDLFFRFKHREMEGYDVDSRHFTRHSHYLFWRIDDHGSFVGRAFHLHPIMVQIRPQADLSTLLRDTIDGDFVGRVVGDFKSIHVVADSDDLAIFSLSPATDRKPEDVPHKFDPSQVAQWAYCSANRPIHRFYVTQPFVMHSVDVDRTAQERVIELSGIQTHRLLEQPKPIRYVGYSHEVPTVETLQEYSSREILDELCGRARHASPATLFKGLRHITRRSVESIRDAWRRAVASPHLERLRRVGRSAVSALTRAH